MDWITKASNSGMTIQELRDLFKAETGINLDSSFGLSTEECAARMGEFKDWLILNL